ncbi:hypothetical protein BH11ARM2_BH11ARM2_04120 [soil metagenome]
MTPETIPAEETIRLTSEQMEMIREAEEAFEKGEGYTLEQAREIARKRTRSWMLETTARTV